MRSLDNMVKFKTLKEATPAPAPAPTKQAAPTQAAPAQAAPAQPQAPTQDQTMKQATEAIKQIVMPVVAQAIQDYLQKNLPALIQNALKGQKQPPKTTAKQPAPATEQDKIAAQNKASTPVNVPKEA